MYTILKSFVFCLCAAASLLTTAAGVLASDQLTQQGLTKIGAPVQVVAIIDGDTLVLQDGREVRLVGIQAPKLPLGRKGFKPWPLADEAKDRLSNLTLGRQVELFAGPTQVDRHDRLLAHLLVTGSDGEPIWVQQQLLADGLARVYSFADNRVALAPLFVAEDKARLSRRGIWGKDYYQVWSAQKIAAAVKSRSYSADRFELVEGRIVDVSIFRDRAYLNFGPDWRDDFSVMIKAEDLRHFGDSDKLAETFLLSLKGRQVRVRGWTYYKNGPMMRITHKERLTVLPEN